MTTIRKYGLAARQLARYLAAEGGATDVTSIRRRDVEGYTAHLLDTQSAGSALTRYQDLQQVVQMARRRGGDIRIADGQDEPARGARGARPGAQHRAAAGGPGDL
jgi:hypothetical protein